MRNGIDSLGRAWCEIGLYGKMKDLSNKKFGRLTALFPVKVNNGKPQWLCLCDCGNYIVVSCGRLTSGNTKSCGCLQKEITSKRIQEYREKNNVIGQKFGRLTIKKFVGIKNQEAIYLFDCDCGNSIECSMHSVKCGNTRSCGCLLSEFRDSTKCDLIGKRFGKLVIISFYGINKYGGTDYLCLCDCGNLIIVSRNSLLTGNTKSCGCISSVGQNYIKSILDYNEISYETEYTFPELVTDKNGHLRYDFAIFNNCEQIIRLIEFDGLQHNKPYKYFGGEEKFFEVQHHDLIKNQYALSHNIPLVRIPYSKRDSITLDDILGNQYLIKGDN